MLTNLRKTSLIALVVFMAVLFAACGGGSEVAASDEDASSTGRAAEFEEFFDESSWTIVERTGFSAETPDGIVEFEERRSYPNINLIALPCGRWGSSPIEWNEQGFSHVLFTSDPSADAGVNDSGCEDDDLHELLWVNGRQFDVEMVDEDMVVLRTASQSLTLVTN